MLSEGTFRDEYPLNRHFLPSLWCRVILAGPKPSLKVREHIIMVQRVDHRSKGLSGKHAAQVI